MSTALSANTTLAHYTIVCKIGAGGMGEVYRARDAERKLKIVDVDGQGSKFDIGESRVLFGGKPLPALPHNPSDWDVPCIHNRRRQASVVACSRRNKYIGFADVGYKLDGSVAEMNKRFIKRRCNRIGHHRGLSRAMRSGVVTSNPG